MKHKTLKRVLCFLLALVVVASMPLDIHANAVAVAPWAVYALITYMAAVGITFTVTGGVDAMVKAVQDKVDEYEKTVSLPLPIWVVIEEGTKLVPPPSGGGPNWNPNRGKFFFTANATAAITAFITWLVSDGGWSEGGQTSVSQKTSTFTALVNKEETVLSTMVWNGSYTNGDLIPASNIVSYGTVIPFNYSSDYLISANNFQYVNANSNQTQCRVDGGYLPNFTDMSKYTFVWTYGKWTYGPDQYTINVGQYAVDHGYGQDWIDKVQGLCFGVTNTYYTDPSFGIYLAMNDGNVICLMPYSANNKGNPNDLTIFTSDVLVEVPEEIPQLQPSTQQGVYIDTSTDAETLEELAEDIKTQFEETGTIPRPVPEVITDPDYAPQPSPVPTPPVYEDVDGLGLPSLAETMKNKFPFCLPYDLGRVFEIFYAEPVAPYWEVDLFATLGNRVPFVGDTSFTIDLAEYDELGVISRWMTTIGYVLLLILITRQTTKW